MLKFYYSDGSSALAAHILLHEVGAAHEAIAVSIAKGEHQSPAFLRSNPKGRIPVLETPDGIITENPAILEFIAATDPSMTCLPKGAFAQAQARSLCAYLCATVHVAFAHGKRGARWADAPASLKDMQHVAPSNLAASARFLESQLTLDPWALGQNYSYCDPYLYLVGRWCAMTSVTLDDFPKLKAHRDAMNIRPATKVALALHGLI